MTGLFSPPTIDRFKSTHAVALIRINVAEGRECYPCLIAAFTYVLFLFLEKDNKRIIFITSE